MPTYLITFRRNKQAWESGRVTVDEPMTEWQMQCLLNQPDAPPIEIVGKDEGSEQIWDVEMWEVKDGKDI